MMVNGDGANICSKTPKSLPGIETEQPTEADSLPLPVPKPPNPFQGLKRRLVDLHRDRPRSSKTPKSLPGIETLLDITFLVRPVLFQNPQIPSRD